MVMYTLGSMFEVEKYTADDAVFAFDMIQKHEDMKNPCARIRNMPAHLYVHYTILFALSLPLLRSSLRRSSLSLTRSRIDSL